jgi:hypothetical protein
MRRMLFWGGVIYEEKDEDFFKWQMRGINIYIRKIMKGVSS